MAGTRFRTSRTRGSVSLPFAIRWRFLFLLLGFLQLREELLDEGVAVIHHILTDIHDHFAGLRGVEAFAQFAMAFLIVGEEHADVRKRRLHLVGLRLGL